ncbi:MAG: hypothetical protein AB2788_12025, partial [Candidatus Thiodiazotropha endolucinida]
VGETQIDEFHVIVFDHLQGFYGHLNLQDFQLLNAEHNQPFVALCSRPRIPAALDNAEKQISCHSNK